MLTAFGLSNFTSIHGWLSPAAAHHPAFPGAEIIKK